ncbi:hypothetical protein FRC12_024982 [Ceratobasidium sp. 428]|nr:hypothetical protein FRC12_024982 [Ceratobasidium sp. 428]
MEGFLVYKATSMGGHAPRVPPSEQASMAMYHSQILIYILCLLPFVISQNSVQIDDSNVYGPANRNGIQFSLADWNTAGLEDSTPHFNGTYTYTKTSGASLIFFFRGSAIRYFADLGPHRGYVFASVDNSLGDTYNADSITHYYQRLLYGVDGLDTGDHQLIISNVGPIIDANNTIAGLDYLSVTPHNDKDGIKPVTLGPGASSVPANAILVDDDESSNSITYSGEWQTFSSSPRSAVYFGDTLHSTKNPGDSCTFKFTGTGVWYFTDYFTGNAVVDISVDGIRVETVLTASAGGIGLTQRLAWSKTDLADGPHNVTLTHAGGGNYASLDFFMYLPSSGGTASSTSSSTSSTSTSTETSTPTPANAPETLFYSSQLPFGAIIGGSVGALAILVLFAAFLIYMRYQRQNTAKPVDPKTQPQSANIGLASEPGKGTTTQFDWMRIHQTG